MNAGLLKSTSRQLLYVIWILYCDGRCCFGFSIIPFSQKNCRSFVVSQHVSSQNRNDYFQVNSSIRKNEESSLYLNFDTNDYTRRQRQRRRRRQRQRNNGNFFETSMIFDDFNNNFRSSSRPDEPMFHRMDQLIQRNGSKKAMDRRSSISKEEYQQLHHIVTNSDSLWGILSNTFFIGGGIFYVIGSIWDFSLGGTPTQSDMTEMNWQLYTALGVLGPFVYLLNSIVDILWSLKEEKRKEQQRQQLLLEASNETTEESNPRLSHWNVISLMVWIKHHVGNRRELMAASTFGMAALFDLLTVTTSSTFDETIMTAFGYISIHTYLLSAAFALCGWKSSHHNYTQPLPLTWYDSQRLEDMGDILFGVASIIDTILYDMTFDDNYLWWPILSSTLWLVDALCYLRADIVTLNTTITTTLDTISSSSPSQDMSDAIVIDYIMQEDDWITAENYQVGDNRLPSGTVFADNL